jgi:hypothetical protein
MVDHLYIQLAGLRSKYLGFQLGSGVQSSIEQLDALVIQAEELHLALENWVSSVPDQWKFQSLNWKVQMIYACTTLYMETITIPTRHSSTLLSGIDTVLPI